MATGAEFTVVEAGYMGATELVNAGGLNAGEVGYITASIKSISDTKVGDTVTDAENPCAEFYASDSTQYNWPANVAAKYDEVGGVPYLDGGYTVFGQVFEGMDVVRQIAEVETGDNDKPLTQVIMESVRIEEYQG